MKAVVRREYGSPDKIQIAELPTPEQKPGEIIVKVRATTANRTDCANLTAQPWIMRLMLGLNKPKKIILGTDFAGEIAALGTEAGNWKVGDRVMGFRDLNLQSMAEYVAVPKELLFPMPEGFSFAEAAASLEGAHYAYSILKRSKLQAGQKVFVNGATGAIGSALLQLAQAYAVEVSATATTEEVDRIKSLGAKQVIDYTKADFTKVNESFDFVFDAVGKSTFGACKSILKERGIYISSELGPGAQNVFYSLFTPLGAKKKVLFPIPYSPQESIPFILEKIQQGFLQPVIDREYPMEEAAAAFAYVLTGQKIGNVVLKMDSTI